jgi:hypothetical protein
MRKLIVPLALLAMGALLSAAVVIDCVRLAADRHGRVLYFDGQMATQEIRLVNVLANSSKLTPEVQSAISVLKSIHGRQARMQAYDALVASFQKTMSGTVGDANPIDRKFGDEAAGAINRREVAKKDFDEESSIYQDFLNSWRGSIAKRFYLEARRDVPQEAERSPAP